jgi:haloalkane dehalogenase
MWAEENLHFLTNSIPGAQGQPHEGFHTGHFIQEEIGDILADRVIRFIEANPELLAAPADMEVEHGRNGKSEEKEKEERMRSMRSAAFPYEKKRVEVLGRSMAYVDEGQGDPIVFLHGNPTSSYLWRNIIPHVQGLGRCLAPDLIGMGDSEKLPDSGPGSYTFVEHRRYLDALLDQLSVKERVTLVLHDWGSALGFDWAFRHPDAVRGMAYMEAITRPRKWGEMHEAIRPAFQALRSPTGEQMVLEDNFFVEVILPKGVLHPLTEEEMAQYRRPFAEPGEARRPTLSWPRQIPLDGEPAEMMEIITAYGAWLSRSSIPKLFIQGEPGTMPQSERAFCRAFPAQRAVSVQGLHFLQEDAPDEVGVALASWLPTLA